MITWCPTKKLGPIGSAVLTFIGYKQTDTQTDKPNLYIDSTYIFVQEDEHTDIITQMAKLIDTIEVELFFFFIRFLNISAVLLTMFFKSITFWFYLLNIQWYSTVLATKPLFYWAMKILQLLLSPGRLWRVARPIVLGFTLPTHFILLWYPGVIWYKASNSKNTSCYCWCYCYCY